MPTASEAIAILRRAMPGLMPATSADAADTEGGPEYGDPSGSLALRDLRGARESELQTRLANEQFGRQPDPNAGRTAALLKFLQGDIASDPYTGTAARGRTQHVQDTLDDAATFDRPEVTHVRGEQQADKLALATAAPTVTGEYGLRHQALENEGAIAKQRIASEGTVDAAGLKGGGAGGKLASGLMERMAAGSTVLDGLQRLRELKDKTTIGPLAGRVQSMLQTLPLVPASADFAAFKAETDAIKNTVIKSITGAQMSEKEVPRILGQVPLETDKPVVWEQKAKALEKITRGLAKRVALLNAGVPASSLDQIPIESLADETAGGQAGGSQAGGFHIQR